MAKDVKAARGRKFGFGIILMIAASPFALASGAAQAQSAPASADATTVDFAIQPQPLVDAMRAFSQATGIQAVYSTSVGTGVASPGVSGRMSSGEALSRLLAGTGLTYRFTGAQSVTLEPAPAAQQGAIQLGPVRVEGGASAGLTSSSSLTASSAITEGTHSYTTNAVTIGKTVLNPRDIPQSISVITRQRIEDQNLFTLPDALAQTPGLTVLDVGSQRNTFTSRGFPVDSIQLDGVPTALQYNIVLSPDLAIYDRVEVIRGANGLLQGSGDPSASINLVRKRPTDALAISGAISAGSWNNYRAEADVGGPLNSSGTLRARVVGSFQDNDYFYDVAHSRKWVVYGIMDFRISPDTIATAGYTYVGSDAIPTLSGLPTYADGGDLHLPRSTYPGAAWNRENFDNRDAFVELKHDFGGGWSGQVVYRHATASSSSKYAYLNGTVDRDTLSGVKLAAANILDYRDRQDGVDAFFSGPIHLFGRSHQLLIGANARQDKYSFIHGNFESGVVGTSVDIFNFDPSTLPEPVDSGTLLDYRARNRQVGAYATGRFSLADPITLILGARVSWWESDNEFAPDGLIVIPKATATGNGVFTPYAGVIYKVAPSTSLYASYADIFQPQSASDYSGKILSPVVGKNYEIGIKRGFFRDTLNASFAIFQIEQANRAITDPDHPNFSMAEGKVRSRGFELEATGNITSNLEVATGYTFAETKYLRDPVNQGQVFNTFTPKHLFKFWANYTLPGELRRLSVGGGVQAQSKTYLQYNARTLRNGGYAIVNIRTSYAVSEHVTLSANLNNIFDKTYYQTLVNTNGTNPYEFYGAPRNFTISLRGKF